MNRIHAIALIAAVLSGVSMICGALPGAQPITIDLIHRTLPDIGTVKDDPFGKLVRYGHALFTDTANEIGPTVSDPNKRFAGNNLACQNCHLKSGGCMERSMNGRALPLASREMKALSSFMRWLSTGVPDGARLVGAGTLQIKEPERAADPARGAQIYAQVCAACHGPDGRGRRAESGAGYQFPSLWGSDSFNNGAGMSRLLTAAAYAMHNMPIGTTFNAPVLSDEDAYDVAAYVVSQKRPQKANLDEDFPIRLQKPVDAPYGPYVDGFSLEEHKFGPFGPIRKKLGELAAESGTANAGGQDNGSEQSERVK